MCIRDRFLSVTVEVCEARLSTVISNSDGVERFVTVAVIALFSFESSDDLTVTFENKSEVGPRRESVHFVAVVSSVEYRDFKEFRVELFVCKVVCFAVKLSIVACFELQRAVIHSSIGSPEPNPEKLIVMLFHLSYFLNKL